MPMNERKEGSEGGTPCSLILAELRSSIDSIDLLPPSQCFFFTAFLPPTDKGGRLKERVPGWCDRILWHSQQDLADELKPERVPEQSINPYGAFRHLVTEPLYVFKSACILTCLLACVKESADRFIVEYVSYNTLNTLHKPNENDRGALWLFSAAPTTQSDRCGTQQ